MRDVLKENGSLSGTYKDEKGNAWKINLNIEYVSGADNFEDGDNTMSLDQLHDPKHTRSQVYANDVPTTEYKNGRWVNTGEYEKLNIAGNMGCMRGGKEGLNGFTILHETMHFLGLTDRYGDQSGAHKGYEKDMMSCGGIKMSQNHWNNWGKAVLANPSDKSVLTQKVDQVGLPGQKILLPEGKR
jgi:hypothetical protein